MIKGARERDQNGNCYQYSMKDNELVYNTFKCLYDIYFQMIYVELIKYKNAENEIQIRNYIKNVVAYIIPALEKKINEIHKDFTLKKCDDKVVLEWVNLYDDYFAMASYRSLRHFALYTDMDRDANDKVWTNSMNIFGGFWYYASDMVLNGNTNFIEKQLPTGYGKSYSDVVFMAWILGIDINNDIVKVFGNPSNISTCYEGLCDLMSSPRYAKVFQYYKQFNCSRLAMVDKGSLNASKGELKITGSKLPRNVLITSKDSKINGARAKYMFLDDITQEEDKANINEHNRDIDKFNNIWFKRKYNDSNFHIILSGTTYSVYDILSKLKMRFGIENAIADKRHKWTSYAANDVLVRGKISAFICVPKLDPNTDESTYPEKATTESARAERLADYEAFMAMDQQTPLPPKGTPFHFDNLKSYENLPKAGEQGRPLYHYAYLDSKRSGKDYCAMPVFSPFNKKHFLVAGIYDNRAMEDIYDNICTYIISYNIIKLYVEKNICEGLDTLLQMKLHERNYDCCNIITVYSDEKKDERIARQDANIRLNIVFPKYGMYSPTSDFGKFLNDIYTYSYVSKNLHDDGIDAVAGYSAKEIDDRTAQLGTITSFVR